MFLRPSLRPQLATTSDTFVRDNSLFLVRENIFSRNDIVRNRVLSSFLPLEALLFVLKLGQGEDMRILTWNIVGFQIFRIIFVIYRKLIYRMVFVHSPNTTRKLRLP
jgi:hypothetical protein